ncbi:MAG TPA: 4-hydroxybenzoate 3-monooxygenase [Solirubrobacteraceae bacterium]|jgi:p-hydroxybenzoate 3-monooxygenase|nr:4-hydroxybenzoate 3-monooxygenase [Solirubrobacteraceae bacterium]
MTAALRTQVGIVGGGPAGLLLGHLLAREDIESVVLEARSREYVEQRVRAGVLEQGTVDLLKEVGVGERLEREGIVHEGLEVRFDGIPHRIPLAELTGGRTITIYGQQKVVSDLTDARLAAGGPLLFEVDDVSVHDLDTGAPWIHFRHDGEAHTLHCGVIAGCDGYHGVTRDSIPTGVVTAYEREYPFAWLGVLAEVPPSTEELIYCHHERGFALHSLRSPELSRLYLQVDPSDRLEQWPDERVWEELRTRFATRDGDWTLNEGPVVDKLITPMRSLVVEPMRHGRLFLAGDAAHIVPATGAKGLNLAVHDVRVLAGVLARWFAHGDEEGLERYSEECLHRVWRVQHFSWWMTSLLHRPAGQDPFEHKLQRAQLRYLVRSRAAATTLAENYTGLASA